SDVAVVNRTVDYSTRVVCGALLPLCGKQVIAGRREIATLLGTPRQPWRGWPGMRCRLCVWGCVMRHVRGGACGWSVAMRGGRTPSCPTVWATALCYGSNTG